MSAVVTISISIHYGKLYFVFHDIQHAIHTSYTGVPMKPGTERNGTESIGARANFNCSVSSVLNGY